MRRSGRLGLAEVLPKSTPYRRTAVPPCRPERADSLAARQSGCDANATGRALGRLDSIVSLAATVANETLARRGILYKQIDRLVPLDVAYAENRGKRLNQPGMGSSSNAWAKFSKADTMERRDKIISRNDIEAQIAEGRKIVIVDDRVLKVDAWLPYHPGGDKAILHMVGRDATNEVRAFHSAETQALMLKFQIGRIQGQWIDFLPTIQGGVFRKRQTEEDGYQASGKNDCSADESSGEENSVEPSPIFEAQKRQEALRTHGDSDADSISSTTSLGSSILQLPATPGKIPVASAHELENFPSLDPVTQGHIVTKYHELDQRVRAAGLYNCDYSAYLAEITRYAILGSLSYYFLQEQWFILSAILLGMLWHQLVFTVHDAGHMGITHDFQIDSCIGIFIADFLGGLSCCWWKRNHNVHHIVTNSAEHDPDIQHLPFFAISSQFFDGLRSSYYDHVMAYDPFAKFMIRYQQYLYYPVLALGRFNLYRLSWQYILLGQGPRKGPARWHRYLEMIGQVFFWYWFGYLVLYKSIPTAGWRIIYLLVSHVVTMPVHAQITLSHFAMSTTDLGVAESFPQRMLRTTMDVDCPPWLDFFHGGLQFQAMHHLFPRIPRHNLRKCQGMVQEFCHDVGIPYEIYGFQHGNEKVIGHLADIAKQAKMLAECQNSLTVSDAIRGH